MNADHLVSSYERKNGEGVPRTLRTFQDDSSGLYTWRIYTPHGVQVVQPEPDRDGYRTAHIAYTEGMRVLSTLAQ